VLKRTIARQEKDYPEWVKSLRNNKRIPTLQEWGKVTGTKGEALIILWHFLKANAFVHPEETKHYNEETLVYNMTQIDLDLLAEDLVGKPVTSLTRVAAIKNAFTVLQGKIPMPCKINEELSNHSYKTTEKTTMATSTKKKTAKKTTAAKKGAAAKKTTTKKAVSKGKKTTATASAPAKKKSIKKSEAASAKTAKKTTAVSKPAPADIAGKTIVAGTNSARAGTVRHTLMGVIMKGKKVDDIIGKEYTHEGSDRKVAAIDVRVAVQTGAITLK